MTKAQLEEELLKLPYEERLEIADMLVASEESPPLHDWHKQALDQALEDYSGGRCPLSDGSGGCR